MDKITILVADDSAPFRDGMRAMLRRETDMAIVGRSSHWRRGGTGGRWPAA